MRSSAKSVSSAPGAETINQIDAGFELVASGNPGAGETSLYLFLAILVFVVVRRMRQVFVGSKVSRARALIFSAYYIVFAAALTLTSFVNGGISPYFAVVYLAVGVAAAYGSYLFSDSRIGFWKGVDGSIYSKGAVIIYLIYVAGLVARILIDLVYIGPSAFSFTTSAGSTLSTSAINAEIIADVLLVIGAGLLVGRNGRVLKRYSRIMQGKEEVSQTPPKISYT